MDLKKCNAKNHQGELLLPLSNFYSDRTSRDKHTSKCKQCILKIRKEYRIKNKEIVNQRQRDHYKLDSEYHLGRSRRYYINNKDRILINVKSYAEQNYKILQQYYANYYQKNKEQLQARSRRYAKENRFKVLAVQAKRRATLIRCIPSWFLQEKEQIELIFEQSKNLTKQTGILHHVDHIVPLKHKLVCGLHCKDNLQILTATENFIKHNKFSLT